MINFTPEMKEKMRAAYPWMITLGEFKEGTPPEIVQGFYEVCDLVGELMEGVM